jgi:hypothetical protein
MTDKMRGKNPENHIVGFLINLFANYGGKSGSDSIIYKCSCRSKLLSNPDILICLICFKKTLPVWG